MEGEQFENKCSDGIDKLTIDVNKQSREQCRTSEGKQGDVNAAHGSFSVEVAQKNL